VNGKRQDYEVGLNQKMYNKRKKHSGLAVVVMKASVYYGTGKRALENKPKPVVKEQSEDSLFWTFCNE